MSAEILSFETGRPAEIGSDEPSLMVDVEGYEGPLDLLLALARQQKVDLHKISILALADQYLTFIEAARKIRLELAADYLVMAAWLAFLKSRLLLPEPATPDGPSAEQMATALANRLRRLEAIREAANRLMNRPQFQRDIFVSVSRKHPARCPRRISRSSKWKKETSHGEPRGKAHGRCRGTFRRCHDRAGSAARGIAAAGSAAVCLRRANRPGGAGQAD